jgi:hypothetical protein
MFYKYSYATCFGHNFGHHQVLNVSNVFDYLRCVHLRPDDDQILVETCSITIFVKHK